jgi:uncharacterized protein (DUF2141 family)
VLNLKVWSLVILGVSSCSLALPVQAKATGNLTVSVEGLRNRQGQVCLSLFNQGQGFPSQGANAVQTRCVKASGSSVKVRFSQLAPGSYAVAVLHDANGDSQANRNRLGIPTEGFGFSRNPRIVTGPPKFKDAMIQVSGSNTATQIQLRYLLGG